MLLEIFRQYPSSSFNVRHLRHMYRTHSLFLKIYGNHHLVGILGYRFLRYVFSHQNSIFKTMLNSQSNTIAFLFKIYYCSASINHT
jgi:hypothetical protein